MAIATHGLPSDWAKEDPMDVATVLHLIKTAREESS